MGLFKGSVSYRRYRLLGDLPEDHRNLYVQSVHKHVFRPIDGQADMERAAGWANIHDPLDTELTGEKLFFDDQMLFSLRVDQKRVPSKVLIAYVQKAEKDYLEKAKRETLTRPERKQIKDLVKSELMAKVLPSLATYDVAIDWTERQVRFWSLSKGVCEQFMELFEATFKLNLLPMGVYGLATKILPPSDLDKFDAISASVFARPRPSHPQQHGDEE